MRGLLGACLVGLILAGCAIQPSAPEPARLAAFTSHQLRIANLTNWTFTGRAAIRTPRDGGSVAVYWRELNGHYRIDFIAPFGAGSARLTGDAQRVRLQTSRGASAVARSARDLLNRYLGYDLPVAALRYWLRGILAPGTVEMRELDRQGRLASLVQQGWRIEFRDYGHFSGVDLPIALHLSRDQVEVNLVIRDWELSA